MHTRGDLVTLINVLLIVIHLFMRRKISLSINIYFDVFRKVKNGDCAEAIVRNNDKFLVITDL